MALRAEIEIRQEQPISAPLQIDGVWDAWQTGKPGNTARGGGMVRSVKATAPTLFRLDPDHLRVEMVECGLDVGSLALAADLSDKTVYTVLHGHPVTLRTAGKIRRAIRMNQSGAA